MKKKGHQNLLANRYFLLAKIQKFPKMCSQKKNSHRRANNANNGNPLGGPSVGFVRYGKNTEKVVFNSKRPHLKIKNDY